MARRRSGNRPPPRPLVRSQILTRAPTRAVVKRLPDPLHVVRNLEDRRSYHPLRRLRPAAAVSPDARRLVVTPPSAGVSFYSPSATIGFNRPKDVSICVRRKVRRETLFGLNRAGRGVRVSKRRRRSEWSNVHC